MRRYLKYSVWLALIGGVLYLTLPLLWRSIQPVKIVDMHPIRDKWIDVILTRSPISDNEKIAWWDANKQLIIHKVKKNPNQSYTISLWDFADGYVPIPQGKGPEWFWATHSDDFFCFDDSIPNCLHKDKIFMRVSGNRSGRISYTIFDSQYDYWRESEEAPLMRRKSHSD